MADKAQPQQVFTDSKWDRALDTCLRRSMYGLVGGGVAALLLLSERGRAEQQGAARTLHRLLRRCCFREARPAPLTHCRIRRSPALAGAPTARATALGVGLGFGLGSAWQQNQDLFHELFGVKRE